MGGEAGRAPSGGLRSCACSRTGWGRHHHHHYLGFSKLSFKSLVLKDLLPFQGLTPESLDCLTHLQYVIGIQQLISRTNGRVEMCIVLSATVYVCITCVFMCVCVREDLANAHAVPGGRVEVSVSF